MKNIYCDSYLTPSGSDFLLSDFSIHIIPLQGIHESAGIVFSYLAQDEDQPALLSPRQVRVRTTCGAGQPMGESFRFAPLSAYMTGYVRNWL
ncbi:MAG: hypothetical protein IIA61_05460 [Candidatus Marinimicrobia bacterium]|nr:hypothetical protein [Candidatus Neomarinimicrobiota bacterium]